MLYEDWRDAILMMCDKLPDRTCPFCEEVYEDDAEYVDVTCPFCEEVYEDDAEYVDVTCPFCEEVYEDDAE